MQERGRLSFLTEKLESARDRERNRICNRYSYCCRSTFIFNCFENTLQNFPGGWGGGGGVFKFPPMVSCAIKNTRERVQNLSASTGRVLENMILLSFLSPRIWVSIGLISPCRQNLEYIFIFSMLSARMDESIAISIAVYAHVCDMFDEKAKYLCEKIPYLVPKIRINFCKKSPRYHFYFPVFRVFLIYLG